jgi:hypothetical protein
MGRQTMKKILIVATLTILFLGFTEIVTGFGINNYLQTGYLPVVLQIYPQPTLTPTITPTIPTLEDGWYAAYDIDSARGEMYFTVINNGTKAVDGGFNFQVSKSCPAYYESYEGYSVSINNGSFRFHKLHSLASLECEARSSTMADCIAERRGAVDTSCNTIGGRLTKR